MSIKKGRVAIVTGAGSGIGRGIATALAEAGAHVIIADISKDAAEQTASALNARGLSAAAYSVNIADTEQCEAMVRYAVETYGSLDILVNNAGIIRDALIHKMSDEQWDSVVSIIMKGTFLCTRAAVKVMKEQKYGRIINISSHGAVGCRGQANYSAAKAGVIALTRTTAKEYAWCGVTANCILPGPIKTPMTLSCMNGKWEETVTPKVAVQRVGTPEDIAYMVCALAAEEASYITSQAIGVDGGYSLT